MIRVASVVLEGASPSYDRIYDYEIPEEMPIEPGCRVSVGFGAANRPRIAMVLDVSEREPGAPLKALQRRIDPKPLLNGEGIWLLKALHDMTFGTWHDSIRALIPPGAGVRLSLGLTPVRGLDATKLSSDAGRLYTHLLSCRRLVTSEKALKAAGLEIHSLAVGELLDKGYANSEQMINRRIADERSVMVRLVITDGEEPKLSPKAQRVVDLLSQVGTASVRELCYFTGATRAVIERLRVKNIVEMYEEIVPRKTTEKPAATLDAPVFLTALQIDALHRLQEEQSGDIFQISLLYGVTGSGKTQVIMHLIEQTLAQGKSAIVLVPEISLTPQSAALFGGRFGNRLAVLHSSLSMTERLDEWTRIREGKADLVVGTRTSVFAPVDNLGLIVVDEEQEHTYHAQNAPRYHARDIAILRAKHHKAHLILCSATPSVESFYAAQIGKYNLVTLRERYTGGSLPKVVTVDMRQADIAQKTTGISIKLAEEIEQNLTNKEQSVLLLNRRGYFTLVKCSSCRQVATCPNCSIPLTYHTVNRRLICHYCGHSIEELKSCPSCKSPMMRYTGVGTQRAAEELQVLFPDARILRMDADTTQSRFSHQRGFDAFARGEYDIMIGTQMVTKGLDFPKVTLVGVLSADQLLFTDDFRGFERTFSMITQVVGRAGRAELPGRAVIQTWSPENRILEYAANQDYEAFFQEEIGFRRVGLYPPFCELVGIFFVGADAAETLHCATEFLREFTRRAQNEFADLPLRILGPAEGRPFRAAGKYRWQLLVKCRADRRTRQLIQSLWDWFYEKPKKAALMIDMNYDANA
jgi:primosomal protein N' (replication factor Y)